MARADRIDGATVRAYLNRDWKAMREAKREYWRARLDRYGLTESLRVSSLHRVPTEQERDEDLETHTRVAKALRRTAIENAPPDATRPAAARRARRPR